MTTSFAYAQVDALSSIGFLQTGNINTSENEFSISNDVSIREFLNGEIVRVSGHIIEGFPHITYSKISENNIETRGIIFFGGEFLKISFEEEPAEKNST